MKNEKCKRKMDIGMRKLTVVIGRRRCATNSEWNVGDGRGNEKPIGFGSSN
jgi:hypothetical protein